MNVLWKSTIEQARYAGIDTAAVNEALWRARRGCQGKISGDVGHSRVSLSHAALLHAIGASGVSGPLAQKRSSSCLDFGYAFPRGKRFQ